MTVPAPSALDAVDVPALHRLLAARRAEMVADLVEYAERETPSDDPLLLTKGLAHLEAWLADRLGPPVERTQYEAVAHGDVVVLEYEGVGDGLTLLAHYDTVWSAGTLDSWPVRVEGDRVTGPGVFDMKAGLVQAVWAIRALRAAGTPHPPLRLVLTGDEEIGSPFSRPLIEAACADAAAVLVFEASAGGGAVKTARKGVGLFDVHVRGVESHAGLDPTAGASAIDEIARAVRTLHAATDLAEGTTVNVGLLRGGTRSNVVAGSAEASIDVRVPSLAAQDRIDALLAGLHAHDPRAAITVSGGWNRPVMERTAPIAAMYALARASAAQLGVDLPETAVGGASDGNFAAAIGLPVLDGLGAVGGGAHARHEHVSVEGMVERAAVAAGVIAAFAG
ncbi:M20 family metallopeptidase [Pseudonocardia cypriaca]|uniref:Glutamate carboxypeptidase n=1 Tax=Pseudonocardia cypriaca TaxID=882449 RepID=A0A543GF46_9PSEU|nr:M20 family metallopeptidase [Pseudonocardia cypriaca]TQM44683.1 glutamate carboxypeptidase [Pseudonocardia cypriaca]